MNKQPIILAIDTSCDETSVAITQGRTILANGISSQIELHKKWGGVVPSIAARAHEQQIEPVIRSALRSAKLNLSEIDAFAVTEGPGLAIALEVGIAKAKRLASDYQKPLIAINHMVGHIYANLAESKSGQTTLPALTYPALALLVSGGHTELVYLKNPVDLTIIGQTLDDAMGEAYDKVAKMLGLGYPGGPVVARLAKAGNPTAYDFPIPMKQSGDLNFSFSGLKTAVLYKIKALTADGQSLTRQQVTDLAASFQAAAFEAIITKLLVAVQNYSVKQLLLGGGVIANTEFRRAIRKALRPYELSIHYPNVKKLCTDNAAMIGIAAFYALERGETVAEIEKLDRQPTLRLKSATRTR